VCWCQPYREVFLTLTYVGILEPILIGFDAPLKLRPPWHWSAVVDFIGGFSFLIDMILTLRTGVVVSSKTLGRRKLVMEPADIARVYIYEAGGALRTSTPPSRNRRLLLCACV